VPRRKTRNPPPSSKPAAPANGASTAARPTARPSPSKPRPSPIFWTALYSKGQTEWDTDFLFKKPFTLSDTVEFMFGLGPQWAHVTTHGRSSDTVAGEAALDFMFWPWRNRKLGFYLEPSYDYTFAHGHEQSLGVSGGLLIPFP
jgi:hypothetical protein